MRQKRGASGANEYTLTGFRESKCGYRPIINEIEISETKQLIRNRMNYVLY